MEASLPNVRVVHRNNFSGLIRGGRVFVLKHTSIWLAGIRKEQNQGIFKKNLFRWALSWNRLSYQLGISSAECRLLLVFVFDQRV